MCSRLIREIDPPALGIYRERNIGLPSRLITISKPVREEPMRLYVPENVARLPSIPFVSLIPSRCIVLLRYYLSLVKMLPSGGITGSMIRYAMCYFWYATPCAGDLEQKGPRVTFKTYRTTEIVSLFMSLSLSFSDSAQCPPIATLAHGRMPCREVNDRVAHRDGFLRGPRFRNADESVGVAPSARSKEAFRGCRYFIKRV